MVESAGSPPRVLIRRTGLGPNLAVNEASLTWVVRFHPGGPRARVGNGNRRGSYPRDLRSSRSGRTDPMRRMGILPSPSNRWSSSVGRAPAWKGRRSRVRVPSLVSSSAGFSDHHAALVERPPRHPVKVETPDHSRYAALPRGTPWRTQVWKVPFPVPRGSKCPCRRTTDP